MNKEYRSISEVTPEAVQLRCIGGYYTKWSNVTNRQQGLITSAMRADKEAWQVPNLRAIKAEFVPMTDTKPTRIKLSEAKRSANDTNKKKVLPVKLYGEHLSEVAHKILTENGFNIICKHSDADSITFMCDNWDSEYFEVNHIEVKS